MYIVGLDVGTTCCKAIVFDPDGNIISYSFQEYDIEFDETGKAEQDAERVWNITCSVLRKAIKESGKSKIRALSLSAQGDAIIPINRNFNALHKAILGVDYRSVRQVHECELIFGAKELFHLTGMRPHPINSLAKILWFKENHPEIYKKTWKITTYADYILGKLGADPVIDYTMASRTMAFDLKSRKWSRKILDKLNIDTNLLSDVKPSGTIVGEINKNLANKLGLSSNTVLVTGGHDQVCAALGAGVIEEGKGVVSTGTAEVLSSAFSQPILTDKMYDNFYPCYLYAKEGMFFTFSLNHIGGLLLKWYRDNFASTEVAEAERDGTDVFEKILKKVPEGPSNIMFMPHLNGSGTPWCDTYSKGAIIGLTMSTTRHDIVRAILESQTYELKINMEMLEANGIKVEKINAIGGGAKSPLWLQIKADILDRIISTLRVREAACLGAAILAGAAVSLYRSVDEGVKTTVNIDKTYYPNKQKNKIYNEKFTIYRSIYPTLLPINRSLSQKESKYEHSKHY